MYIYMYHCYVYTEDKEVPLGSLHDLTDYRPQLYDVARAKINY